MQQLAEVHVMGFSGDVRQLHGAAEKAQALHIICSFLLVTTCPMNARQVALVLVSMRWQYH